jgi:hypothetical protein
MRSDEETVAMLEEAIERLQIGIVIQLTLEYGGRLRSVPPNEAVTLANCVLRDAIKMNPVGEQALQYGKKHRDLVQSLAIRLLNLEEVAKAMSYLYAAMTSLLEIRTRDPFSESSRQLGTRATELSLHIPSPQDICGSGDANKCTEAILAFSMDYRRRLTAR